MGRGQWALRSSSTSPADQRVKSADPVVVSSPHRPVTIPENQGLTEFVLTQLTKFGDKTAMVSPVPLFYVHCSNSNYNEKNYRPKDSNM